MAKGYLALILHAHLPFVRHPEHQDSLEENWLYQAITEVYVPLLLVLEALVEDGVDFRLTFSLSPTLLSMLADPWLQSRYLERLERLMRLAEKQTASIDLEAVFRDLATRYCEQFAQVRNAFLNRWHRDLVQPFRRLQDLGKLEIIASAATHGYLPLLSSNPSAVRSQVDIGLGHYRATFGRTPKGFWLPECGYYPGVDRVLFDRGIRFTILETHGITRAKPRPRYGVHAPIVCPSGLAAFGRDPDSSRQVWSAVEGYPGDYDYREFYRDLAHELDPDSLRRYVHCDGLRIDTGIKYYRITGKTDSKQVYDPQRAERKAELHAEHFRAGREAQIRSLASLLDRTPIVVAPYDAELFGHWWYEGPRWLNFVIRGISAKQSLIRLVTLSEYLEEGPRLQPAAPPLSSWGEQGFNQVWLSPENQWIYPHLRRAAAVMEQIEKQNSRRDALGVRALRQAKRELLLAQASDWAFMIHTRSTAAYATARTKAHLANFHRLTFGVSAGNLDSAWLSELESRDSIFAAELLNRAIG